MTNLSIFKHLIDEYTRLAYTHHYIFGFEQGGNIYFVYADADILPYVCTLDKASKGQGYSLRFKPNREQKEILKEKGFMIFCSKEYFEGIVAQHKKPNYNRGQIFEKLVTEYFGQEWRANRVAFTDDGDITINGVAYQIKYTSATFTNEQTLMNLMKKRG